MLCPSCQELLVPVDRDGVEIDYCPHCRGVWLDRGELDKILERASLGASRPAVRQQSHYDDEWHHDEDYKRRHPHKRKRMKSFLEDLFDFD
ncbi:MAG: zf-TFIIB domain-containing protein [Armatimonadota bacterium]|nr:zf-TFIIB domain-containing protein [bacterium]MDW8319917.1 zf-TFIIB domain-containing protein [Armatimonadota bacterium]